MPTVPHKDSLRRDRGEKEGAEVRKQREIRNDSRTPGARRQANEEHFIRMYLCAPCASALLCFMWTESEKPKVKKKAILNQENTMRICSFPNLHFQAIFNKDDIYMLLDLFYFVSFCKETKVIHTCCGCVCISVSYLFKCQLQTGGYTS